MKVFYFNDELKEIVVKVMDQTWDYTYTSNNAKSLHRLKPGEGRLFDLACPHGAILFVKKWEGIVLLSYADPLDLPQPTASPQQPENA
jgi:hypothetical protein